MIYTENFKMSLKDIGKQNKIKNRAILEILENIAGYQSDYVGFGANETVKTKIAWVLLDWKLEVIKRPTYGQTLQVKTWGRNMNKFFTYRDYEIYDENNELCIIATSKWTLLNIEKRKMVRLTEELIEKYKPEEKSVFLDEKLDKIKIPTKFISNIKYKVIRKDIDLNKHMHNLYYLDLAYEALPEDVYEKRPFDSFRIQYKKEVKLGDVVKCRYTFKDDEHIVSICNSDGSRVHAIIVLK